MNKKNKLLVGIQCTEFEKKKCGSKNLGIPRHFNDPKTALELIPRLLAVHFLFMQSFYLTHALTLLCAMCKGNRSRSYAALFMNVSKLRLPHKII